MILDNINFSAFGKNGQPLVGKEVVVCRLKIDDDVDENLENWNFTEDLSNKKSMAAIGTYAFSSKDDDPNRGLEARFIVDEAGDADVTDELVLEPGGRYIALIERSEEHTSE